MGDTIEASGTDSRLDTVRKLLAKAEATDSGPEAEALTNKASDLIARYGIDRAMLAESGKEDDPVVDKVIFCERPYAENMRDLLSTVATSMRASVVRIKQFDPEDHGGRTKGAWHFGLRIFAHQSDMLRIEVLYVSLRTQAVKGMARITGESKFAQDQRAHRISYLEGFNSAIWGRLRAAEREAQVIAEAEREKLAEKALLAGYTPSRSVELVLADRNSVVRAAFDLAVNGITPERRAEMDRKMEANRERWVDMDRKAEERHAARVAEQAACGKCKSAKSGYCSGHRDMRPVMGRATYERVGAYFGDGWSDGQRASLGNKAIDGGQSEIGN